MRRTFLGHSAIRLEIGEHDVPIDPFPSGNSRTPVAVDDPAPPHVPPARGHAARTDARCDVLEPGPSLRL